MAVQINTFTATSELLTLVIDTGGETIVDVKFILHDESEVIKDTPDLVEGDVQTFTTSGDFSNGIFKTIVNDTLPIKVTALIGNLLLGTECLLKKTLNEEYDCILMQELEASRQYIFLQKEAEAREVYSRVEDKCSSCVATIDIQLAGISIWIVNDTFVIQ